MKPFVLQLSDLQADLPTVGGKGMSLAILARAGLPVPDGFHITTEAYRCFVAANGLQPRILAALERVDAAQPVALEAASRSIGKLFAEASLSAEIGQAISSAYTALSQGNSAAGTLPQSPVAVRSSATAEDLPNASFAGQQDTYLNIRGTQAVLAAVQQCWASLWTARAIAYRLRQGISPENVALAVVVQRLVPAEAAGILFTANPLTGKRDEIVINAAWGLGEAVVGGLVTPDTITVERSAGRVIRRETAVKQVMTIQAETGTTEQPVPERMKNKAVLTDPQIARLAGMAAQIEPLYGQPMDIEWALAAGQFAILQARPITTLGEAPLEWKLPEPKGVYMRGSLVDLMPDPLSPLFATLGLRAIVDQFIALGTIIFRTKPALPADYLTTINSFAYMNAGFSTRGWLWVLFVMLPGFPRVLRTMVPYWREQARPHYQQVVAEMQQRDMAGMTPVEVWQATQKIMQSAAHYTDVLMFATMGASAGSEGLLTQVYEKLARREGDPPATALLMGWDSLPNRAEKSLYDLAEYCRDRECIRAYLLTTPADLLAQTLNGSHTPEEVSVEDWQEFKLRFNRHLDAFGYMIFDLDFARPLPRDHPEPMLEAIKMYLRGAGVNPYVRQKDNQERRIRTAEQAAGRLKGLRRWAFSKALHWAQSLSEIREDALADIGLGYPLMRQMLHRLGEQLVQAGVLLKVDDIFWLEKDEVEQAVAELTNGIVPHSQLALVEGRQAFWKKAKRSVPPPILPPRKKLMGINTSLWLAEVENDPAGVTLKGVSASPGRVTAPACLLHGPEDFERMRPGNVLVAGTTTPAWTPLFAMASGVVTDIGGPLSHGSIVAREYGIPAVMGTGVATHRIPDGQTITVDGTQGLVTMLDAREAK